MVNQLDPQEVTLEILAIQGRYLPNKDFFKKQDPFLQFEIGHLSQRTKVDKNGGTRPEWNSRIRFERLRCPVEQTLKVICYDSEWKRKEQFIGECVIDIGAIFKTGEDDGWFKLNDRGSDAGEIYLELTFFSQDGFSKLSTLYASASASVVTLPIRIPTGPLSMPPPNPANIIYSLNNVQNSVQILNSAPSHSSLSTPHKHHASGSIGSENGSILASSVGSTSSQSHNYSNAPVSKPLPNISAPDSTTSHHILSEEPSSIVSQVGASAHHGKHPSLHQGSLIPPSQDDSFNTLSNLPSNSHNATKASKTTSPLPVSAKESKKPFTIASFVPSPPIKSETSNSSKSQNNTTPETVVHSLEKLELNSHPASSSNHYESLDQSFNSLPKPTIAAIPPVSNSSNVTSDAHGYVPSSNSASSQVQSSHNEVTSSNINEKLSLQTSATPGYLSNSSHLNNNIDQSNISDSPVSAFSKPDSAMNVSPQHSYVINSNGSMPHTGNTSELMGIMNGLETKNSGYLPPPEVFFPPSTFNQSSHDNSSKPLPAKINHNSVITSTIHSVTPTVNLNNLTNSQATPSQPSVTPPIVYSQETPINNHIAPVSLPVVDSSKLPINQIAPVHSTTTPQAAQPQSASNSSYPAPISLPAEQNAPPPHVNSEQSHANSAPVTHVNNSNPYNAAASNQAPPASTPAPATVSTHQVPSSSNSSAQPALPPRPTPATLETAASGGFVYQFLPPGASNNPGSQPPFSNTSPPIPGNNTNSYSNPPVFPVPHSGNTNNFPNQPPGGSGFHFSPPTNNNFPAFPSYQSYMPAPPAGYGAPYNNHGPPPHMPNLPMHGSWGHSGPPPNTMPFSQLPPNSMHFNQSPANSMAFNQPPPIPNKPSHMPSNYGQNVPPPLPSRPSSSPPNHHGFPLPSSGMPGPPTHYNARPGPNMGYNGNQLPGPSHHPNSIPVLNPNNFQPPSTEGKKKKKNKLGFLFS